jgi:cystathionine beta-lyase
MARSDDTPGRRLKPATTLAHSGRDPSSSFGFVNTPVYRGSTVLFPTLDKLTTRDQPYTYGRRSTPTVSALEETITKLEGGAMTVLTPSGLAAVSTALLAFAEAGDHILIVDNCYQPTRACCDHMLAKLGVETEYYDPLIGGGIARLIRPNTRLILTESPGSQTLEMQDIPAIAAVANAKNIWLLMDNTWATPLYFQPLAHGVDVSIQSATKYFVGHADANLGAITANERASRHLDRAKEALGICPGSEETFLGLRGLRTLQVRLERNQASALAVARWLEGRPEIERVIHPALPSHPQHDIWKRDFTGASGLFAAILKPPVSHTALAAFLDGLKLFGMGYSWGGYESLVIPFDPRRYRTATQWNEKGQALRFHIGLEDVSDLIADLEDAFARLAAAK